MSQIKKEKIEYVIGIDLGHGETSAAVCPMQWDKDAKTFDPAKDLEMGNNRKVLPSAITILDDGRAYIGEAAFNPANLQNAEVRVCFKQAPKDINGEAEQIMTRFMSEVYKRIRENNAYLSDGNHLVYIATPSGWDKNQQDLYMAMAKKAGLPMGGITKESRAAFVRAQHDVTSGLGRNIQKGAIVFDMGSSTLDFTYMSNRLKGMIDYGYNCGASFIEKSIYDKQEKDDKNIQLFEKRYPELKDYLLFEARKVKEQVYFNPTLKVKKSINFDDFIEDDDLEEERFKIVFQPGELNEYLSSVGYLKQVKDAMVDFKNSHIAGHNIYGVFMTGGASRMDFLRPLISECWGIEEKKIYRDNDPSLTISQGVAEVARLDLRTEGMDDGLEQKIDEIVSGESVYSTFVDKFAGELYNDIVGYLGGCVEYFRDADENYSLSSLQKDLIPDYIGEAIKDAPGHLPESLDATVQEAAGDVINRLNDIREYYSSQGVEIDLPALEIGENFNVGDINLDSLISSIADKIADESINWAELGMAIFGIIGAVVGYLVDSIFGDSEEKKKEKAMTQKMDKDERLKVYNYIMEEETWKSITDNVEELIRESLNSNDELKEQVEGAVRSHLLAYKKALQDARVLID